MSHDQQDRTSMHINGRQLVMNGNGISHACLKILQEDRIDNTSGTRPLRPETLLQFEACLARFTNGEPTSGKGFLTPLNI